MKRSSTRTDGTLPEVTRALPRVGWLLNGDFSLASSRLQGYRIHEYLTAHGFDSRIIATGFGRYEKGYSLAFFEMAKRILRDHLDVVFFQKPEWMMFKMSEMLRVNGVNTAAIQCDPFPGDYGAYFDRVILTSDQLRETLGIQEAQVIDDMLEVPPNVYKHEYASTQKKLRLVWTGQGMASFVNDFFQKLNKHPLLDGRVEIVTIGPSNWASVKWSLDTVYENILSCDIAVIPLPQSDWSSTKSTNRLSQFMALGMPTVASPIDSYLQVARRNAPFLIAKDIDDFAHAIDSLKTVSARSEIGTSARHFAWANYSPDIIGPLWVNEAEQLLATRGTVRGVKLHTQVMGKLMGALARLA